MKAEHRRFSRIAGLGVSLLTVFFLALIGEGVCFFLVRTGHQMDGGVRASSRVKLLDRPARFRVQTTIPVPRGTPPVAYHNYDARKIYEDPRVTQLSQFDLSSGYSMRPNSEARAVRKIVGERKLYDVRYTTDSFGRRRTPGQRGPRNRYLAFWGCSFIFGEGLEDNETLPYYVSRLNPKHRAYNYGVTAYGTNMILAQVQARNLRLEIPEKEGTVVYVFTDQQVPCALATRLYVKSILDLPYFFEDSRGQLRRGGTFRTGRSWISGLYLLSLRSHILDFLNIDFPLRLGERHFRLVAKMIAETQAEFRRKKSGSPFFVVFAPRSSFAKQLIPYFEEYGIHYLDYSEMDLDRYLKEPPIIEYDGHPSAAANRFLARLITRDLGLQAGDPTLP